MVFDRHLESGRESGHPAGTHVHVIWKMHLHIYAQCLQVYTDITYG